MARLWFGGNATTGGLSPFAEMNAEIFGIHRVRMEGHSQSPQKTVRLHHSVVTWPPRGEYE